MKTYFLVDKNWNEIDRIKAGSINAAMDLFKKIWQNKPTYRVEGCANLVKNKKS